MAHLASMMRQAEAAPPAAPSGAHPFQRFLHVPKGQWALLCSSHRRPRPSSHASAPQQSEKSHRGLDLHRPMGRYQEDLQAQQIGRV